MYLCTQIAEIDAREDNKVNFYNVVTEGIEQQNLTLVTVVFLNGKYLIINPHILIHPRLEAKLVQIAKFCMESETHVFYKMITGI